VPGGSSGGFGGGRRRGRSLWRIGQRHWRLIRQPAALSGVVGFKPTYGRVLALWSGRVCVVTRPNRAIDETVRDSALIMNVIAGHDAQDSTSLREPVPDYAAKLGNDLRG